MSARREDRRGIALLAAVVVAVVVGVAVLALWRGVAASRRVDRLDASAADVAGVADSALAAALQGVDAGAWRGLRPGASQQVGTGGSGRASWRAWVGRSGWGTVVARGAGEGPSGVPRVPARADGRAVVPLEAPLPMPVAALTGVHHWLVDPAALVVVPAPDSGEVRCRDGVIPIPEASSTFPDSVLTTLGLVPLDPDTVTDSVRGAVRLVRGQVTRVLRINGMVVVDTDLVVGADLGLTGVLVVRGAVRGGGGRLEVSGAVVSGEGYGGQSGLGPLDWVRYDACAIRRAVEWVTRPAGIRRRTSFHLF